MERYIETQAIKELRLHNPLTEEEWALINDWEFDRTNRVAFLTPLGKEVEFVKVVRCKDCKYSYDGADSWCCSYGVFAGCIMPGDFYCKCGVRKEG